MEETQLFGKKESFGIEIQPTDITNSEGYLRLWVNGKSVSMLNRKDEYIHSIRNLKKYFISKEHLYEPIFNSMSDDDLIDYLIPWDLVNNPTPENYTEIDRRKKYIRWFAQIDLDMFSFYKDGMITWIIYYHRDKKNPLRKYKLLAKEVEGVFNDFINWYEYKLGTVGFNSNVFP